MGGGLCSEASLSMGCALLRQDIYSQAKVFFMMGLQACIGMEDRAHQQLPYLKLMRGMSACLEGERKYAAAMWCHTIIVEKLLPRSADAVARAHANVEWSALEIRCGLNDHSTTERLQAATRDLREAARIGDHRAPDLLDEALGELGELVPPGAPRKRLRRKTRLEDLDWT